MNEIIREDIEQILQNDLPWKTLSGKTFVVVTGEDMLYSYFVHVLMKLNASIGNIKVIAVAKNTEETNKIYSPYQNEKNFHLLYRNETSVFEIEKIREITGEIYCVLYGDRWDTRKIVKGMTEKFLTFNVLDVLSFLRLNPDNFLFHSTIAVYGDILSDNPLKESDLFPYDHLQIPNGIYKETRKLAESICCSVAKETGQRVIILRAPSFYGPGTDLFSHYPLNDFLYNIIHHENIIINSDGSPRRDFSYFSDVVAGYFYALFKGETCNVYNLTSTQDLSLKELANIMVSLYPKRKLQVIIQNSSTANDGRTGNNRFLIDISKAKSLGWSPRIDIETGIKRTVTYFEYLH